jgi:zinc/manganese transport system substrate-binding protein
VPNTLTAISFLPRRMLLASATALSLLGAQAHAADKVPVTASFSILGDLVRSVGGGRVAVTTLVGPNEDAHVFEPKPKDAKALLNSKLLVTNGLGFEPWADKLARSANYKGEVVVASRDVKTRQVSDAKKHADHGDADPHAWQNPNNVVLYVRHIAVGLSKADPDGAVIYQSNAESYVKELVALDTWAKAQFAAIPLDKRKVITSHDAFGYLAAQYGVQFLAPQGVNTDAEPSAKQVAQLIAQIKREKIRAVFVENMSNPKLLAQLSKDAGATVGASLYADALSAPEQPGATYLQMMRHNITQLVAGMKQNDGR